LTVYNTKAETRYVVGEWAKAPAWLAKEGYGLFVFDSLANAKKFIDDIGEGCLQRLWECRVDDKYKVLPNRLSFAGFEKGCAIQTSGNDSFPEGTVMVRKVKLIKQITKKESNEPKLFLLKILKNIFSK